MIRIGLFGGTFDPVHRGHIAAGENVKKAFGLEKIIFIPSAVPPHKSGRRVTDSRDRLAMLRLAVETLNGFSVSDCELRRPGLSYTVDTVCFFLSDTSKNNSFHLILGHDAFMEMHTWKSHRFILELIPLIVMLRPGVLSADRLDDPCSLYPFIRDHLSEDYCFSDVNACYNHPELKPIYIYLGSLMNISSTEIRNKIRRKERIATLVPMEVENYIIEKGLYT